MTSTRTPRLGFRVLGTVAETPLLADAGAALAGHAAADPKAEVEKECYLSAFWFADDFREHLRETGSRKGYDGVCWAPWLWWDIDRKDDLEAALSDARGLASRLLDRYPALDADDLLLFFSGSKGFHVGLPTFWGPAPSIIFHRTARLFAEALAADAKVRIDSSVYDKVRLFRAPNSRHPKTGLHKRRLAYDELMHLPTDRIRQLASEPAPFDLPIVGATCDRAAADWIAAEQAVEQEARTKVERRTAVANGEPRLNRGTLAFISGNGEGESRHIMLFSAAANLAEFGCPPALAHALLTERGLDSGLSRADVRRQIECGLAHGLKADSAPPVSETPIPAIEGPLAAPAPGPDAIRAALAELWANAPQIGPTNDQLDLAPVDPDCKLAPTNDEADADAAEQRAEAEAIVAGGGRPAPPAPPTGARFIYQSERGRPCGRARLPLDVDRCAALVSRCRVPAAGRGGPLSEPHFQCAADALVGWRGDVLSGEPPVLFPVGTGELARVEIGPGLVTLLGGAPGSGKTAFTMQAIIDALRLTPTLRALVCNIEMSPAVLLDRQLARLSGIDGSLIRHRQLGAEHAERIDQAMNTLDSLADRLAFVRPPFDLDNVAASGDAFDAGLILLDYIQRIPPPGDHADKRGSVNYTMDKLREFATEGQFAVVVVSAVGRTRDSKGRSSYSGDGLNLASFRESSELEFGADDAFILVPDDDLGDTVTLRHLKSRHGECRDIALTFDRKHQRFTSSNGDQVPRTDKGKLTAALSDLWGRNVTTDDEGADE